MTLPSLIGIAGRMHSGKDTLGKHLVQVHGYHRFAFADQVKEAVVAFDPMLFEAGIVEGRRLSALRMEDETAVELCNRLKNEIPELRRSLQAMGNEVGQGVFGPHFWIDQVLREAPQYERVVITDVRYPHECDRIREAGGHVIRITRPGMISSSSHPSESLVDECKVDVDVINEGTIEDFVQRAIELLHV